MSVNLLVIGEITPQMQARLEPVFTLHSTSRMDDVPGFLAAEGASIGAEQKPRQTRSLCGL